MRKIAYSLLLLTIAIGLYSCNSADVNPNTYLSFKEQEQFKYSVSRYVNHLAKYATEDTKFDARFDDEYRFKAQKTTLDKYYIGKGDTVYFEVSKIAPSLQIKKIATGGKMVKDKEGKIVYYNEVYRTWKMDEEELKKKTKTLFDRFINGKDLSKYYTQNSGNDLYIEFPDDHTTFDLSKRVWERK